MAVPAPIPGKAIINSVGGLAAGGNAGSNPLIQGTADNNLTMAMSLRFGASYRLAGGEAELEQLIRKHLGNPEWSEDYYYICRILKEVSHRFNEEADQLPSLRGILDEAVEEEEG